MRPQYAAAILTAVLAAIEVPMAVAGTEPAQFTIDLENYDSNTSSGEIILNWSAVSNRIYSLHWSDNLMNFQLLQDIPRAQLLLPLLALCHTFQIPNSLVFLSYSSHFL